MLVHVIHPTEEGIRFEFPFKDKTPDRIILAQLASVKRVFGYNGIIRGTNPMTGEQDIDYWDPTSGFAFDHEHCVVAIGKDVGGDFVEERRLKGPPDLTHGLPNPSPS